MIDPMLRRRPLPPPLVVGLAVTAACLLFSVVTLGQPVSPGLRVSVAAGLAGVGNVQLAYGLFLLAERHAGAARRGLRVAAVCYVATLGFRLLGELSFAFDVPWSRTWGLVVALDSGTFAVMIAAAIGLGVAAWRRSPGLGVAVMVIWIGSALTALLIGCLSPGLGLRPSDFLVVWLMFAGIRIAVLTAVVVALAGVPQAVAAARLAGDLRRTARVLRVTVAGMIALTAALALLTAPRAGHTVVESVIGALAVMFGIVVFCWLGLALLGAARDRGAAIAPYPLALAGTIALWCSRMLLTVLPDACRAFVPSFVPSLHSRGLDGAALLALPVAAAVGAAMLAATISAFARRLDLDELLHLASRYVYCVVAALFVGPLVLVKLVDHSASVALLLVVGVCVALVVLLARLCGAAAAAVEQRSDLPEARVVG